MVTPDRQLSSNELWITNLCISVMCRVIEGLCTSSRHCPAVSRRMMTRNV
jgi:hypothetical protein